METNSHELVEKQAFDIATFCLRNGIGETLYHRLKREGRGPREMRLGSAIRITRQAELDWQKAREKPSTTEARLLKREAKHRQQKAQKAGAAAARSPKHASKTRRVRGGAK